MWIMPQNGTELINLNRMDNLFIEQHLELDDIFILMVSGSSGANRKELFQGSEDECKQLMSRILRKMDNTIDLEAELAEIKGNEANGAA